MFPKYIISGGQTGADRAALDFALSHNIACGGYCPKGRYAEDGRIDKKYPLKETAGTYYQERTRLNVSESDGTLIFICGGIIGKGTHYTRSTCIQLNKPFLVIDLFNNPGNNIEQCRQWIQQESIEVINIAGNRESTSLGIYRLCSSFLSDLFAGYPTHRLSEFDA
ncbi:MAG TPA: putative molybdenum carrier protein [Bacteroidales bacterium]|nr:putative molybdenum carrier protein [Bacteroidales bacterium]